MLGNLPRASIVRWQQDYNVTISLSLVITSIYPCPSVYANVKCRTRDNTSPYSAFWRKMHMTTGISKMKTANLKETRKTKRRNRFFLAEIQKLIHFFFFYPYGCVLLSTNLSLTPSCGTLVICSLTTF